MILKRKVFGLICLLCMHTLMISGAGKLVINEIQVANLDQYIDPSWNYGSWVELYNPTEEDISLMGYWISNDPQKPKMLRITQKKIVPARGYANLWFDHHDKYYPNQIDLKLDADGGVIILSKIDGTMEALAEFPPCIPRASWARTQDGGQEWEWSSTPTPESSNNGMIFCMDRVEAPQVNEPSQIFTGALSVKVDIPEGCTLRYTTDGRTPSLNVGETSNTGDFLVTDNRVYRFALFREGLLMSPVVTRSFLLHDKTFNLPVISVVTGPDNLYSNETGIFVRGINGRPGLHQSSPCNWNMDWDRPCNFELLDAQGHSLINQETDIKRCGAASRAWKPYSFKIHARKTYEHKNSLDYPFFPAKPYLKHKTLQIRNGGNDTKCRVLDPFLQQIVGSSGLDIDYQEYQPVAHYINGIYKGVINMREPNNKHHVYANYGLDEDEIDLFEMDADSGYVQQCGTNTVWKQLLKLSCFCSTDSYYEQIRQLLDIDEFCNYMAVVFYLCCTDWPNNNLKAFRPIEESGRFRFILYDMDWSFLTETPFTQFVNKNTFTFNRLFDEPEEYITQEIEVVTLFLNLLRNNDFRKHFIDTFCIVAGSVFEPARCNEIITRLANNVCDMQLLNDNGYGMNYSPWETANQMIASLNASHQEKLISELKNFANMKLNNVTGQIVTLSSNIKHATLQINGQTVPTGRFSGTLFLPVTLRASASENYKFLGWVRQNGFAIKYIGYEPELTLPTSESPLNIVAYFSKKQDNEKQCPVVINEVSASNSIYVSEYYKKSDWIELYNMTDEAIDLKGIYLSDNPLVPEKYKISADGTEASTLIPAHGYRIVWCDERENLSQLHAPFKLANDDFASIVLTAADESWSDTFVYCAHEGRESVGRFPDGGINVYKMPLPTIGKSNAWNSYTMDLKDTFDSLDKREKLVASNGGMNISFRDDMLYIRSEENRNVTLNICTLNGTLVMSHQLCLTSGKGCVSTLLLLPGMYVAYLVDSDGNQCSKKFLTK